jgi:hypothetical protein
MQFWRGFLAAMLTIELAGLALVFVRVVPAFVEMMADVGEAARMPVFVLVTSREYAITSVVGLVVLAVAADRLPPDPRSRLVALGVVAAIAGGVLGFTLYGVYAPIFAIAGNIE